LYWGDFGVVADADCQRKSARAGKSPPSGVKLKVTAVRFDARWTRSGALAMSLISHRRFALPLALALGATLEIAASCSVKTESTSEDPTTSDPDVQTDTTPTSSTGEETSETTTTSEAEDDDDDDVSTSETQEETDDPGSEDQTPSVDLKWDLGGLPDIPEVEDRCTKIDFLFVVDNSRSMEDEQIHLTESFPGFIEGITEQVSLEDYRIMVVKSDSNSKVASSCTGGACTCEGVSTPPNEECCIDRCLSEVNMTCAEKACTEFPEERACPDRLGTGVTTDQNGMSCNFASGSNYILADQPNISDTFACAATVGIAGNYGELMIDSMLRALSEDNLEAGGCNEGFIREDAILVITLITDEEEKTTTQDQGSMGDPPDWKARVMAVKGDNETAVLVAGFIGDTGQPGAICEPMTGNSVDGAQESPRLREFVTSFGDEHSLLASVCEPDYAPAFKEMVDKIAVACDNWTPK
jgi:hypothetical protein